MGTSIRTGLLEKNRWWDKAVLTASHESSLPEYEQGLPRDGHSTEQSLDCPSGRTLRLVFAG
jgi:hypothetical protein